MTGEYWVSCERWSGWAKILNDKVIDGCPGYKRFIGQPFANLSAWLNKFGGFKYEKMKGLIK